MTLPEAPNDHFAVLARARAVRFEAERLQEIAFQRQVEALIATFRAERVALSPAVEAELHLRLSKPVPDVVQ